MIPLLATSTLFQCGAVDRAPAWLACDRPDLWWYDADGDGFGDPSLVRPACSPPGASYVQDGTDCDDFAASANPDADEICDRIDNDCDDHIDAEDISLVDAGTVYGDGDRDGHGAGTPIIACESDELSATSDDCDDSDPNVSPSAEEVGGNQVDDDCDGEIDEVDPTTSTRETGEPTEPTGCDGVDLVINELYLPGDSTWYVELYNPTPNPIDVDPAHQLWVHQSDHLLEYSGYTRTVMPGEFVTIGGSDAVPNIIAEDDDLPTGTIRVELRRPSPNAADDVCISCDGSGYNGKCFQGYVRNLDCANESIHRASLGCDTDAASDWVQGPRSPDGP